MTLGSEGTKVVRLRSLYSCEELCSRTRESPGDPRCRAAARCSLPDFDPEQWDRDADVAVADEAERKAAELTGTAARQGINLDLDLDRDGCPWGWALSRFAGSVEAYVGRRDDDSPVRAQNLRLLRRVLRDEQEPVELLAAVELYEAYEDGAYALFREIKNRGS